MALLDKKNGEGALKTYDQMTKVSYDGKLEITINDRSNGKTVYSKDHDGKETWYDRDADGNILYMKDSTGEHKWYNYDQNGNITYYQNGTNYKQWHQYDEKGRETYSKFASMDGRTKDYEQWTVYADDGRSSHWRDSDGNQNWSKYDEAGKKIHFVDQDGNEESWQYDDKGNEIHWKQSLKLFNLEVWKDYDQNGNLVHERRSDGQEKWFKYDEKGNILHCENSDGSYYWCEYDENGNEIHYSDERGFEVKKEYDDNGNLTHCEDSEGFQFWNYYDNHGRLVHTRDSDGKEEWIDHSYFEASPQVALDEKIAIPKDVDLMKVIKERVEGLLQKDLEVKEIEMNQTFKMIRTTEIANDGNKIIGITVIDDNNKKYIYSKSSTGEEHWSKYDDKGNEIYYGDSNGAEISRQYREYDDNGNKIHQRDSSGFEENWQYDDKGNEIYYRNSNGDEISTEYDENGNKIHQRNSDGYEEWTQYDQNGNEIHFENSEGLQHWKDYDQNGNLVHYRDTNKLEYWSQFNENGQEISRRTSEKLESWYEYDEKGNLIHASNSEGYQEWWKYNKDGKVTHYKDTDGDEKTWKYDKNGVLRTIEDSDGNRYSYNVKGDLIHSKHPRMFENWSEYLTLTIPQGVDLMKVIKEQVEQGFAKPQEKELVYKIQKVTMNDSEGQRVVVEVRNQENNVVYFKGTNGDEAWYDYNDMGKLAHLKTSFGREEWYEYDQNGNEIHFRDNFGVKRSNVYEYDEKGRIIFHIHPDDCQDFYNYDENGGYFVSRRDPDGKFLSLKKYDQKGNITYSKNNFGDIFFCEYEYNDLGQKTYCKHSKGEQEWWEYNANGKVAVHTSSFGYVESHEYDEKGNEIHYKESHGEEIWSKYDKDGNLIHSVDNLGGESKYEYSILTIPQGVDLMKTIKERVEQEFAKPQGEKMQDEQTYKVKKTIEVDYNSGNKTTIQILNANNEVLYSKDSTGYEEWRQYDGKGNEIYYENSKGYVESHEYDEKGNKIHERTSEGFEKSWQYDDNGNLIYYKNSHGHEMSREYDEKGNQIYQRNSNGLVISTEYDEKGNKIHQRYSDGFEESWQYDDKGNEIHFEKSSGHEISTEYDEKGNKIYQRYSMPNSSGFEKSWQYDDNGNKIYQRDSSGFEQSWQYDDNGNEVYYKNSHGYEKNWQYDKNGQLIHYKDSQGSEGWNEYSSLTIPNGDLMKAFKKRVEQELAKPQGEKMQDEQTYKVKKTIEVDYNSGNKTTIQILNANNEVLYSKDSTGYEEWRQYDDKGNEIYYRNSNGYEISTEYDEKGNQIHQRNSNGFEESWQYDDNGNVIHHRNSDGFEISTEYDENGNKIYQRNSDGLEGSWQYDDNGNVIHHRNSDGLEISTEYDEKGNKIHERNSDGFEQSWQYEDNGNEVYYKNSHGYEISKKYDENGNKIHQRNSDGFEESWQYEDNGNVIHYRTSEGFEISTEYDENGQLIHYKDSQGTEEWWDKNNNLTYCKEMDGVEYWNEYSTITIPQGVDLMEAFKERVEQELAKPQKLGMLFRQIIIRKSNGDLKIRINNESNEPVYHWDSGYYGLESFYTSTRDGKSYTKFNDFESWKEHDENGNEIYYKDSDGLKIWREYDKDGREVHFREEGPEGHYEQQYDYSPDGRMVHSKDSDGYEEWHEYDEKGNEVYYKNSLGEQYWQEYDQNGNKINYNSSDGVQQHWKYDDRGNKISYIFTEKSNISELSYAYDQDGRLVSERKNENGKLIYDMVCSFDEHGNLIYQMKSIGETKEEMYQEHVYDEKARILHTKRTFSDGGQCDIWNRWEEGCDKPFVTKRTIYPINYKDPINGKGKTGFEKTEEYDERGNLLSYSDSLEEHQYSSSVEEFSLPRGCDIMEAIKERIGGLKRAFTEERIRDAWQVAASNLRIDVGGEYNLNEKLNIMNQYLLEKDYYHLPNDGELKNLATVLRGIDAIEHGVDSLDFTRQNWSRMKESFLSHIKTKSWDDGTLQEIIRGYKEDNGVFPGTRVLRGTDSIFDNKLVVKQAEIDGQKLLLSGRDLTFPDNSNFGNLKEIYIDTPSNRAVLDEYLREDFRLKSKKELSINERVLYVDGNVLKVAQVASVSEDDGSIHIRSVPAPIRQKSSQLLNQQVKLEDKRLIKDEIDLYRYLAKNVGGEKGFVISDSVRLGGYKGLIKIEPVNNISLQPKFDGKEVIRSCVVECADNSWKFDLRSGQDKLENTTIGANTDERVHFVADIDSAVNLVKDISDMGFNLSHYFEYAVNNPQEVFLEIKDHYYMIDYKIDPYIEGLAKTNKENHYLDELLYESCIESNESLFEKLVNAGADLSWRRNECGKSCNILHYTAADLLVYATELVVERLVKDGKVDLLTEMLNEDNFENLSPNEVWKLRVEDVKELDDGVHYARDLHFLASQKIDEHQRNQQSPSTFIEKKENEQDVVKDFLDKVKRSLPDKVEIDSLFKVAATILDGYNKEEKVRIGAFLAGMGAENKNNLGKFLSEVLDVKQFKESPTLTRKKRPEDYYRER